MSPGMALRREPAGPEEIMPISTVTLLSFRFPEYLETNVPAGIGKDHAADGRPKVRIPVGHLTDDQAGEYWDIMKGAWHEHVMRRRAQMEIENER